MREDVYTEKAYDNPKFIGKIIRNARKKAGLTQEKLAEMLDMNDKTIGGIENGKQFPLVKNFLNIIEVLNIPLSEFGINNEIKNDTIKEKLLKIIYSSSSKQAEKYLKALNFVDDIVK